MFHWPVIFILSSLVATCGHKGPLYLPEDESQQALHYPGPWSQHLENANDL
ncbi:MAG: LPS translocon maturation chaperone LptM [Pseudomonadales bacterium]